MRKLRKNGNKYDLKENKFLKQCNFGAEKVIFNAAVNSKIF